jgi:hypothetical protein
MGNSRSGNRGEELVEEKEKEKEKEQNTTVKRQPFYAQGGSSSTSNTRQSNYAEKPLQLAVNEIATILD